MRFGKRVENLDIKVSYLPVFPSRNYQLQHQDMPHQKYLLFCI